MVYIPEDYVPASVPEDQQYEGTELDPNVLAALPTGTKINWVATYGASFWAISTKIDAELPSGEKQSFFLKVYTAERAKEMATGELEGTRELHSLIPEYIPRPVGVGPMSFGSNRYFFLAEFRDMTDEMPGVSDLVSVIATIHKKKSPNGKFGFQMTTFHGNLPMINDWCDTWEEYFSRQMKETLRREREVQGPHEEMERLADILVAKVIPRLLRPMESNGRKIEPVLVHGDLWHGNIGVDNETDKPVLYDPCVFYAHNEFDFHTFRAARYRTSRPHVRAYHRLVDMTPPAADQDDRNVLYGLWNNLQVSTSWSSNKKTRQLAIDAMKTLAEKYGGGYEAYQESEASNSL